jgi:hypothetical protein
MLLRFLIGGLKLERSLYQNFQVSLPGTKKMFPANQAMLIDREGKGCVESSLIIDNGCEWKIRKLTTYNYPLQDMCKSLKCYESSQLPHAGQAESSI